MVKRKIKAPKIKKKKWFEIISPSFMKGVAFAEALAESPEKLIGKTIITTAGTILGGGKRYINIKLKINEVKTSSAHTEVNSITVSAPYIMRKVRHNSKIAVKCTEKSKNNKKIDLKICAITNGRCVSTIKKEIRKILKNYVVEKIKNTSSDALIIDLLGDNIQRGIKKQLHKIFPMRTVELEKVVIN